MKNPGRKSSQPEGKRIETSALRCRARHMQRAVLGIEPRTSRTLSENHATRPNSQLRNIVIKGTILSSDPAGSWPHFFGFCCPLTGQRRVIVDLDELTQPASIALALHQIGEKAPEMHGEGAS